MKTLNAARYEKIKGFCLRHNVGNFSLFGSCATGRVKAGSDVDVLVSFKPGSRPTLADLAEMREELESIFGKDVDLVEEEAIRNPYRRASILRDKKTLYAA